MSWDKIDDKHKKAFDRDYVSCEESFEMYYVIKIILEHYPFLTRDSVESAVIYGCKTIQAPRPRKKFLQCVASQLGMDYQ